MNAATLEDIFTKRLLVVPDYQRGYAWEDRQLNDFLEDLELLPEGRDHYTGTLVLHEVDPSNTQLDAEGASYRIAHVVDGQQRLTTAVLLLDAIRREMDEHEQSRSIARGIGSRYVSVVDLNQQPLFKLQLNNDTHDYWVRNVLEISPSLAGPTLQSHHRLNHAREVFSEFLVNKREELGEGYEPWLRALFDKLAHRLRFNLYEVEDTAEVGVIFETMNDRGKDLTELEKVKNYLLYLSSKLGLSDHGLSDLVNNAWKNILERLAAAGLAADEDQFLRAHWLMAYNHDRKSWESLQVKAIKQLFHLRKYADKPEALLTDLKQYVTSLEDASVAYCDIMYPRRSESFNQIQDSGDRERVARTSEKIVRMGALATFLPFLMAARKVYASEPDNYVEALELCERFAFRVYRVMEKQARAGQSSFFKLGFDVFNGNISHAEAMRRIRGWMHNYAPPLRVEEELRRLGDERDWYRWPGIKYLLYEYEEYLARNDTVVLPWNDVAKGKLEQTIEHILPQTPTDEYWTARFDVEARARLTNDLGNLCLTSHNSNLSNKSFPLKKGSPQSDGYCYARSNLFQERELTKLHDWDLQSVISRHNAIVEWALTRWHVDAVVDVPPEDEAEISGVEPDETDLAPGGHPIQAATAEERPYVVMARGTQSNPYMLQSFNAGVFKPWKKGAKGSCSWCDKRAVYMAKGVRSWFSMCDHHASRWTGFSHRVVAGAPTEEEDTEAPADVR